MLVFENKMRMNITNICIFEKLLYRKSLSILKISPKIFHVKILS